MRESYVNETVLIEKYREGQKELHCAWVEKRKQGTI